MKESYLQLSATGPDFASVFSPPLLGALGAFCFVGFSRSASVLGPNKSRTYTTSKVKVFSMINLQLLSMSKILNEGNSMKMCMITKIV